MVEELQHISSDTREALKKYYFKQQTDIQTSIFEFFYILSLLQNVKERDFIKALLTTLKRQNQRELYKKGLRKKAIHEMAKKSDLEPRGIIKKILKSGIVEEIIKEKFVILSFFGSKILENWEEITKFIEKNRFVIQPNRMSQAYLTILYECSRAHEGISEPELSKKLDFTSTTGVIPYINNLEKNNLIKKFFYGKKIIINLAENGENICERIMTTFEKTRFKGESTEFLTNYDIVAIDIVNRQTNEIKKGIDDFNQYAKETFNINTELNYQCYKDRIIFFMNLGDEIAEIHICFIIPPRVVTLYKILDGKYLIGKGSSEISSSILGPLTLVFTRQSFHSPWIKYTMDQDFSCYIQSDLPFDNITRNTVRFILESVFYEALRFRKEIEPSIIKMVMGDDLKNIELSIMDIIMLSKKGLLQKLLKKDKSNGKT